MASIFFFFFQTISLVHFLVVLACTASLLTYDEECSALFKFKQTHFHQNYYAAGGFLKFDSWRRIKTNTSDCCLFDGVVCSNKGHVIGLDLSQSSLTGVINSSSSLFKLVHLQVLNLSMNNFFESQIPPKIACLKQLRSLDLSYSGFVGQIPNEMSRLILLSWLDLSGNPGLKLQSHGHEHMLQNMTRLESLYLSSVDLNSSVPRFLVNFSSLMHIRLRECRLQDEFPSAIFHLPKLKYIDVGNNPNLTGSLPEFHNNTLLKYLSVSSTGFNGIIPKSISNINHLEFFSLKKSHFSGPIPGSLLNLTQLTFLSLANNEFTGLVPSLASLLELTALNLAFNNLEMGCTYGWINKLTKLNSLKVDSMNIHEEILPYIVNLTKLTFLSMRENFIFGQIPTSFMNLTQLTLLDVGENQLQGPISSLFRSFKSLKYLNIGGNNFSGTVRLDSFLGLNELEILNLDGNSLSFVTTNNHTNDTLPELKYLGLSFCNLKEFPSFLRFQMKMIGLFLSGNEIEGLVPNWIWNNSQATLEIFELRDNFITGFHQHHGFLSLSRLKLFDMAHNQLQGSPPIPPQSIVFYDVSNNNLTGKIPPLICEMKSLQLLDLSSNNMIGMLPSCFKNLFNVLSVLDLKRNIFHGPVMNTCRHGSLLKKLDLSENRFNGKVSRSLASCTNLEFLSLADNSFKDVFPVWLGTLPMIQVLILRSNKFFGAIQGLSTVNSQFHKLRIIDISNNNFSGELPNKSFQTWNAMKFYFNGDLSSMGSEFDFDDVKLTPYEFTYSMTLTNKGVKREYVKILNIFIAIDLSCNNFEGQIPLSLQDLHGLESLNLSNNHFTGPILSSLGNLKKLESLDLSKNELSGQIPQQLLQLGFLSILNVSFNHLDGRIPQGKQFDTFDNNSYMGNRGLCGIPLSIECENSKVSTVFPSTNNNDYGSLMPSDIIDWVVILLGVGSGLLVGVVIGSFVYARYGDSLLQRFGMRKDKWVRPLRNTKRN
ncbi:hypothetical protein QVD17_00695 [Tagetes erecta]|uniref:Leucine-rich repeat-containing N-terminal plant-type domain-containing protein n=1 Tax=Tagetes erecta TaxID=13708 RepID=A0AAD8P0S9_TARER|nr:hypothetical protein QVD17_00695 [Tagetes erecta]